MAKTKKAPVVTGPQPRADINGWVLCPGDAVLIIDPKGEHHGLFAKVDSFPTTLELSSYVQIDGRPSKSGRVLMPCAMLRWMSPDETLIDQHYRPTRPGQRVRVVLDNTALASEEMKRFEGKLGTTTEFSPFGNGYSTVTVKLDDPGELPAAINSFDLLVVPIPVVQYVPEPDEAPAIPEAVMRLSTKAWDALETIASIGGECWPKDFTTDQGKESVAELVAAGLLAGADGYYLLTGAGRAALPDAGAEPAPAAVAPEPAAEFRNIPLEQIAVTRNTRQVFDETALAELAQSIRERGVIAPVVVRRYDVEGPYCYELVAGERRLRASKLAGLAAIPAMVRVLDDRAFIEVQLLENLQRQDVRPSDEAQAFAELLNKHKFSAEEIALKVGKPVKFVLQRAKLTALEPFWMELLEGGRLPLVAAHELARLPANGQELVAKEFRGGWELKQDGILSARSINGTINSQVLRHLDKAPWPKDDAQLYPKAGPCTTCQKRSGACRGLFEDLQAEGKADTCLDAGCFSTKTTQYVQRRILEVKGTKMPLLSSSWDKAPAGAVGYRYWDSSKEGVKGAVQGLMVDGADAGHLKWVVMNKSAADAAQVAEQKKADRNAEIRQGKVSEKFRQLLTGHLYTAALSSKHVLEAHLDNQIYSELRSQGGPHTVLRFGLVEQMGWELPEGGEAALKKLTPASNMEALQAWQKKNVSRLNYDEKLALYFALLGYNCSTFDVHNDRLQKYAKAAGANPANLKKAAETLVDEKTKGAKA